MDGLLPHSAERVLIQMFGDVGRLVRTDQNLLTVGLTSSTPNEGKSLVNVLLAKTISDRFGDTS